MKTFHSITTTVFAKEDENLEEIKKTLTDFFPFDLEKEKIKIDIKKTTGFEDKTIKVLKIKIEKQKQIKKFIENLFKKLTQGQKEQIKQELKTRIDEKGNFYIRFDKQNLIKDKILFITDTGDCFHMKYKIAAYPCNKEKAIEIMRKIFK